MFSHIAKWALSRGKSNLGQRDKLPQQSIKLEGGGPSIIKVQPANSNLEQIPSRLREPDSESRAGYGLPSERDEANEGTLAMGQVFPGCARLVKGQKSALKRLRPEEAW